MTKFRKMSKSTRHIIIIIISLYAASFTLAYLTKPLSVLICCKKKGYESCPQFFEYFRDGQDGCSNDYQEFKDVNYGQMGATMLFGTATVFLIIFLLDNYTSNRKSHLQIIDLNQSRSDFDRKIRRQIKQTQNQEFKLP